MRRDGVLSDSVMAQDAGQVEILCSPRAVPDQSENSAGWSGLRFTESEKISGRA